MKTLNLITICCIVLSITTSTVFCQIQTKEQFYKNKVFDGNVLVDTTLASPQQMARIHKGFNAKKMAKDHYYFSYPWQNLGVRFVSDTGKKSEIYEGNYWGEDKLFKSILIDGNCGVEFSALDVTEKNAVDYRYHVVQNDSRELVTWTKPSVFKYTTDGKRKYAYLGKFDYTPGQVLKIEIYNIKNYRQYDAMLIDWRNVEAAKAEGSVGYTSRQLKMADNSLLYRPLSDTGLNTETAVSRIKGRIVFTKRPFVDFIKTKIPSKDVKFRLGDSLQNIAFFIDNGRKIYNYKVSFKRDIDGHVDSINLGETNYRFDLYKDFWQSPGKYQVTFTPKIYKHGGNPVFLLRNLATSISFTVLPALSNDHSIPLKTVEYIILIILSTCGFIFVQYRRQAKQRLKKEAQNKQIATLQLQSVRAQLNPHFIFNALAGIQNLMNKNAVEDANKYLTRFARLTRNVLDDGQKELTTIEHEAALLNDYLQMEQLRFSFKFTINTNDVDPQIEIPAMLLQPFAENAVKHGVSALKDLGIIDINISRNNNNLTLSVADNGKGFTEEKTTGMGIKLCEERIRLLNSIYKNISILMHKKSDTNGTLITIELNNWLQ